MDKKTVMGITQEQANVLSADELIMVYIENVKAATCDMLPTKDMQKIFNVGVSRATKKVLPIGSQDWECVVDMLKALAHEDTGSWELVSALFRANAMLTSTLQKEASEYFQKKY